MNKEPALCPSRALQAVDINKESDLNKESEFMLRSNYNIIIKYWLFAHIPIMKEI